MSIDVRASGNAFDLWHVRLPTGVVRTLSLDELDAAFQAGTINEQTMVLKAGSLTWTTLAAIAGIEEEPEPVSHAPNSLAPFATDLAAASFSVAPLQAPSANVSLDTAELAAFRPKRRVGRAFAVVAALALIGGAGFGAKHYGIAGLGQLTASGKTIERARAVAIAPPPPAVDLPKPSPAPEAAKTDAGISVDALPAAPPQKADKRSKKAETTTKKRSVRSKPKTSSSPSSSDPTLRGSGQFDPLNGNL